MTEDHVELCGTPIFDSLVDEVRRANSELNEQRTEADKTENEDCASPRPA
ncbi:hypothetical protein [Amycolatopsis sp. cmx-11-12]